MIQCTVRWRSDYRQMALGPSPYQQSFGTPGQTIVSGDRQRETTHEICCYESQFHPRLKIQEKKLAKTEEENNQNVTS